MRYAWVWLFSWPLIVVGVAVGMILAVVLAIIAIVTVVTWLLVQIVGGAVRLVRGSPRDP